MAIQTQGFGGVVDEVDSTFRARRVSIRPTEVLTWESYGGISNGMTAVTAASPIFALRNIGTNLIIVRRVQIGFVTTTAFTTAQGLAFRLTIARAYTVNDSGGNVVSFTGNNLKHRTSLAQVTNADMRQGGAGAITAGTRTLDANPIGIAMGSSTGLASTMAMQALFQHDTGDYPLILAQNEGMIITNEIAMAAAGVINLYINLEYAEAVTY